MGMPGLPVQPVAAQRIVEAMDEVLVMRQARLDRGFDLAAELAAPDFEARNAATHFIGQSTQLTTREAKIRALAKAGAAILTMIEVQIERQEQERLAAAQSKAQAKGELAL